MAHLTLSGVITPQRPTLPGHHSSSSHATPILRRLQCYIGLALLILLDRVLRYIFSSLNFPSPLIGMTLIVFSLVAASRHNFHHGPQKFFDPAVDWVAHKWLPCFYAPALVTLPLALAPLSSRDLATAVAVIGCGIILTCAFTARVAIGIRTCTATEYEPVPPDNHPSIHFSNFNYYLWTAAAAVGVAVLIAGVSEFQFCGIFLLLLASTILGYMGGMAMPDSVKRIIHPIVMTAIVPNIIAAILGTMLNGKTYHDVLKDYLTKGQNGRYGPGDVLFSFLGVIILCFGFKIFQQWTVLCRHRYEVLGATAASSAFSLLSTAVLGRVSGLPQELARGLVPRSATLALALPIAIRIDASPQITAAAVALTGIIGCNFVQTLMTAFGANDPVSRGLAAAATAHGLGTAAMAAKEPEALPFAALSYALCGVSATLWACIPLFRDIIVAITG